MAKVLENRRYTGKIQPQPGQVDEQGRALLPYFPSEELVEAVNLAIYLQRPLLLKGEPGCGKTRLASAVAFELSLSLETWYVKSTSRAQDGLYVYDAVARLRDAQLAQLLPPEQRTAINNPATYVRFGPLGKAFQNEDATVVLIDEIDKADIDFPNDLLLELDEKRFVIPETGEEIAAKQPPLVIISSNAEKDLPDAFLRRCLFHYVEFPDYDRLTQILTALFPKIDAELTHRAVQRFEELRAQMEQEKRGTGKKVSTSELIDWVRVLQREPKDEVLSKLNGRLPYAGVLLKNWDDHQRYLSKK